MTKSAPRPGLKKCPVCKEYRGTAIFDGIEVEIICICEGIHCTLCHETIIRRPISNRYIPSTDRYLHTPWFLTTCWNCNRRLTQ